MGWLDLSSVVFLHGFIWLDINTCMDSIKQNHTSNSDLHKSNPSVKSHAMQQQSEWYETCLRGTRLDGAHANARDQLTSGQRLQMAYRQHIEPYSKYLQFAVTLTIKTADTISVNRFENYGDEKFKFTAMLDDEKIESRITYFTTLLRYELYGNMGKNKKKQEWATPLVITAIEGRNTHKRTHLHLAIGNIPADKIASFQSIVESTWQRCDFANRETCIKQITDSNGWLGYITKEVGYTDNDALDIVRCTIPPFIQQRIRTESSLRAE